ncbi:hypothetical protein WJX74_004374 [Apatococcus lobatus]|uniref:mannan endo-1,4-beta-mannosidase n=1 Tax=Apatococcus lobatus TaxID=904363 RepID=A0AAW1S516_9CHLO
MTFCGVCLVLLAIQNGAAAASTGISDDYFVSIDRDGDFANGCTKFFFSGWNQWEAVEMGAGAPVLHGPSLPPNMTSPQLLREIMDQAVSSGLTVMRAMAFGVSPEYALETSPGQYSETIFRGMDYMLDQARQRGIKVLLALVNNWGRTGGVDEMLGWSSTKPDSIHESYFSDPGSRQIYKQRASAVLGRINVYNGRRYSEDPTILGWNLINEPRCFQCPDAIQSWIQEMVPYLKSLDGNHLLSIGEEGFYSSQDPARARSDPQSNGSWALTEGQDFLFNHNVSGLDFATMHSWVDNWLDANEDFLRTWIRQHIADAAFLKLPLVLEEHGKWVKDGTSATQQLRDQFYSIVYQEVEASAKSGGPMKGAAFWQYYAEGQIGPAGEGWASGLYGVRRQDSTWGLVQNHASVMKGLNTWSSSCNTAKSARTPAVKDCSSTRVNGTAGTGYEGPNCDIDIDECVRGTAGCASSAACRNTPGGFTCQCFMGYTGNGTSCMATSDVGRTANSYVSSGTAQLACNEGSNVLYPPTAPGFRHDPTNYTDSSPSLKGGFGSNFNTSAIECAVACQTASSCNAFSYNPFLQQCFLKADPSSDICQGQTTTCQDAQYGTKYSCGQWQTYLRQSAPAASLQPAAFGRHL